MVATLESYMAETSKSYDNSRKALQNQIDALSGQLASTQNNLNKQYAQQQQNLNDAKNYAGETASMQAAGSGGSFGGKANIANRKYYQQNFVPAQTQLNTNKSNALENAQQQSNSNRLTLEQQLANLNDQANQTAISRYDTAKQAEGAANLQRELANKQIAAQNAAYKYMYGSSSSSSPYSFYNDNSGGLQFYNTKNNSGVRFATYANANGVNNASGYINTLKQLGLNNEATRLSEIMKYNPKKSLTANTGKNYQTYKYSYLSPEDNNILDRLGLKLG